MVSAEFGPVGPLVLPENADVWNVSGDPISFACPNLTLSAQARKVMFRLSDVLLNVPPTSNTKADGSFSPSSLNVMVRGLFCPPVRIAFSELRSKKGSPPSRPVVTSTCQLPIAPL